MSRATYKMKIVLCVMFLVSLSCNLPVKQSPGGSKSSEQGSVKVVEQAIFSENLDTFAEKLASHEATNQLMQLLRSQGYASFTEGGDIRYSNGSRIHALSISNGEKIVVLAQIEAIEGNRTAVVLEVVDQDTVLLRNQDNIIELTILEDGKVRHSVQDSAGKPVPDGRIPRQSPNKLASITTQGNACTSGMAQDYEDCLRRRYDLVESIYCGSSLAGVVTMCTIPPYADCLPFVGLYLVECGMSYRDCMDEMVDDPPTAEVSEPKELEAYSTCLNDTLFTESLYQVQVICMDDRQPKPNDLSLNLTSGEAKDFICTDCSGRSTSGTIPPPGEVTTVICEYGCLIVGDGKDRCLKQGEETQPAPPALRGVPAGTYIGTTTLPEYMDQSQGAAYYRGSDLVNRIRIVVAEDGTVSGDLRWTRQGDIYLYDNGECSGSNHLDYRGTISGILTGDQGEISLKIVGVVTHQPSGCKVNTPYDMEYDASSTAAITVNGDILYGTIPNSFSFTATRQ